MKRPIQSKLADRFHRGFVYTCMGLTAYGMYMLGHRVYRHFTVIKPEIRAYEQKLVKHGSLPIESHTSEDNVPQLKV